MSLCLLALLRFRAAGLVLMNVQLQRFFGFGSGVNSRRAGGSSKWRYWAGSTAGRRFLAHRCTVSWGHRCRAGQVQALIFPRWRGSPGRCGWSCFSAGVLVGIEGGYTRGLTHLGLAVLGTAALCSAAGPRLVRPTIILNVCSTSPRR